MVFLPHCGAFCAATALLRCAAAHAQQQANLVSPAGHYDLRRLNHPSAAELASEKRGRVQIYDSLETNEGNAALDENFERIPNTMFIRISRLSATGSGPAEFEDDGYDYHIATCERIANGTQTLLERLCSNWRFGRCLQHGFIDIQHRFCDRV